MASLNPPDPPLEDEVVALRGWRTTDAPDIARMFQDRIALEWTRAPAPYREGDARQWLAPPRPREGAARQWLASLPAQMRRGDALPLAVTDAADGSLLASIELRMHDEGRAEFGYVVAAWARGRGVGTRALRLYTRWAFDTLGLDRLQLLRAPGDGAASGGGGRG